MDSHESYFLRIFPHWLKGTEQSEDADALGWGTRFAAIIGRIVGTIGDEDGGAHEAARLRFVATAPADGLPYLAADTKVPRFLAGDSDGELRTRIGDAWGFHDRVGKEAGVDQVMEILGFDPAETHVIDRSNGESWVHESGWWSTWWVVSRNPTGWAYRTGDWATETSAGTTWETMSGCWDVTADPTTFTQLHSFLWDHKWSHGVPAAVLMLFGAGDIWDVGIYEGTTFADLAAVTWDDAGAATTTLALRTCPLWDRDIREANGDTYGEQTWNNATAEGQRWYGRIRPGS